MLKNSAKSNVVREKGSHKWALLRGGGWVSPTYNDQMSTLSFPKGKSGHCIFPFLLHQWSRVEWIRWQELSGRKRQQGSFDCCVVAICTNLLLQCSAPTLHSQQAANRIRSRKRRHHAVNDKDMQFQWNKIFVIHILKVRKDTCFLRKFNTNWASIHAKSSCCCKRMQTFPILITVVNTCYGTTLYSQDIEGWLWIQKNSCGSSSKIWPLAYMHNCK